MYYSFIYTLLHFIVFICLPSLLKVSVRDLIHSASDCCLTLGQNIYQLQMTSWKFSSVHVGEEIQSSNTFMYIHFSHYANPPKCIVDTADIRKTLDIFISISSVNDLSKLNWRNSLSSLVILPAILLQNIGTKWWLLLVPGTVFDFKRSSRSARTLTIEHRPFSTAVREIEDLIHNWKVSFKVINKDCILSTKLWKRIVLNISITVNKIYNEWV